MCCHEDIFQSTSVAWHNCHHQGSRNLFCIYPESAEVHCLGCHKPSFASVWKFQHSAHDRQSRSDYLGFQFCICLQSLCFPFCISCVYLSNCAYSPMMKGLVRKLTASLICVGPKILFFQCFCNLVKLFSEALSTFSSSLSLFPSGDEKMMKRSFMTMQQIIHSCGSVLKIFMDPVI